MEGQWCWFLYFNKRSFCEVSVVDFCVSCQDRGVIYHALSSIANKWWDDIECQIKCIKYWHYAYWMWTLLPGKCQWFIQSTLGTTSWLQILIVQYWILSIHRSQYQIYLITERSVGSIMTTPTHIFVPCYWWGIYTIITIYAEWWQLPMALYEANGWKIVHRVSFGLVLTLLWIIA